MRTALAVVLLLAAVGPSVGQDFSWYPVAKPNYFYSESAGLGLGAGINGSHLFQADDAVRARFRLQQFRQSAQVGWASRSPSIDRSSWLVAVRTYRNLRESFYGVGPTATKGAERYLHRQSLEIEFRRSHRFGGGLWLQPRATVSFESLHGQRGAGAIAPPLPALTSLGRMGRVLVVQSGADLAFSMGDWVLQAHATYARGSSGLHAVRVGSLVDRTWTFDRHRTVVARVLLDATLRPSANLPYFLLPRLDDRLAPGWDRNRFYGADRLLIGVSYVHPLIEILKSHAYEAVFNLSVSQVYDDIADQFSPRVVIAPHRAGLADVAPLEPTFAFGSRFVSRRSGKVIASAMLGFSAEGIQATTFSVTQRLSGWYPAAR